MTSQSFTLPSYAKINWALSILGKRPDGYHELQTVFQSVSLHDTLTFEGIDAPFVELHCTSGDAPANKENLVYKAAVLLRDRSGTRKGARITLDKRIPSPGGLGGGSSNAAVTLLGLSALWDISISRRELIELGTRLGADVPFFLFGGTALGTGTGTQLFSLKDVKKRYLLIATPDVKVSTANAFEALQARTLTKHVTDIMLLVSRTEALFRSSLHKALRNDFESVIFSAQPEIKRARAELLNAGAEGSLLAGSGASVFGLFETRDIRDQAFDLLSREAHWSIFTCETISRLEYMGALQRCAAFL